MEVTKEFSPIHLTLKTEMEARMMWLALNYHARAFENGRDNLRISDMNSGDALAVGQEMWEKFNAVFPYAQMEKK